MDQIERKKVMEHIYTALVERGYRPMDQIIGYILTDDPTYITNHFITYSRALDNGTAQSASMDKYPKPENLFQGWLRA